MSERKAVKSAPVRARLARALLALGSRLPITLARGLGGFLGGVCGRLPVEPRDVTDLNLKLCFPEMAAPERRRLVRRSLAAAGQAAFELGALWRWPVERLEAMEEPAVGEELFTAAKAGGRGIVLLAPHLGNWEFLNHFLMRHGQLVTLYRPPRIAELDALVREARGRTGCVSAPATRGGVRRVLRALAAGELVLILPDQEPLKAYGVHAPFFGVPALTMTLVSRILKRTGATSLYAFAERRQAGRFRVRFSEPPEDLADRDEVAAAAALNRGVEACVRLCPEQYLWSYKRFKTAPPGELTPYHVIWGWRRRRQFHPPPLEAPPRRRRPSRSSESSQHLD